MQAVQYQLQDGGSDIVSIPEVHGLLGRDMCNLTMHDGSAAIAPGPHDERVIAARTHTRYLLIIHRLIITDLF